MVQALHRLDLTQITMSGGLSKKGLFGAVAKSFENEFPAFVLHKPCKIHKIRRGQSLVFDVFHAKDCESLGNLHNAFVVLLFSLMPSTEGFTCNDANSLVKPVIVPVEDNLVRLFACLTGEGDAIHRPTRLHIKHPDRIEYNVGIENLRESQFVFPVFHIVGASHDSAGECLLPHITVSDVILCHEDEEVGTPT